jgi:hypothetical protein
MPLKEVMGHAVDYAAWTYWDRTGWIDSASGTVSRAPKNPASIPDDPTTLADDVERETAEKAWIDTESGAIQLIEISNVLRLPGYVRVEEKDDNGDWLKFAERLGDAAHEAQEAAEAKDVDRMFVAGGKVFDVCTDCHAKYLLPHIDPKTGEIPTGVGPQGEPTKK